MIRMIRMIRMICMIGRVCIQLAMVSLYDRNEGIPKPTTGLYDWDDPNQDPPLLRGVEKEVWYGVGVLREVSQEVWEGGARG